VIYLIYKDSVSVIIALYNHLESEMVAVASFLQWKFVMFSLVLLEVITVEICLFYDLVQLYLVLRLQKSKY